MSTNESILDIIESAGLRACNRTELYQMCQQAGLNPVPANTREELMALIIIGTQPEMVNDLDSWRHGLAGYVLDHWRVLQNQIKCPLKSQDPLSCFGCLDTKVTCCLASNESNLISIRKYRK